VTILALKVDVETLRGTREGVPNLVALLGRHGVGATFLFSLGPDHTGRAIRRVLQSRTSAVRHYGVRTLLYGTLFPAPDIGRRAAQAMRSVRDEGFEVGIHAWDHVRWQHGVLRADASWTAREMQLACERFTGIFKSPPTTHGAAGWQMSPHALRLTQRLGFEYCSDGRGAYPHLPVVNAELIRCPQLPTTLPTLDEMIGVDGVTEENVAAHLLARTEEPAPAGHVFTLHAELEGMRLAPAFEQLLVGWKAQGWQLGPMRMLFDTLQPMALPRCEVGLGSVQGRSGTLLVQGPEFLGDVELAQAA
jgi:peptidoglycan/xylan/chitin deacetylase (PgdA/CDA1 family)